MKQLERLAHARQAAAIIANERGRVTVDDVRAKVGDLFPATAASMIFKGDDWECLGWTRSGRAESRGRMIRVWRRSDDTRQTPRSQILRLREWADGEQPYIPGGYLVATLTDRSANIRLVEADSANLAAQQVAAETRVEATILAWPADIPYAVYKVHREVHAVRVGPCGTQPGNGAQRGGDGRYG